MCILIVLQDNLGSQRSVVITRGGVDKRTSKATKTLLWSRMSSVASVFLGRQCGVRGGIGRLAPVCFSSNGMGSNNASQLGRTEFPSSFAPFFLRSDGKLHPDWMSASKLDGMVKRNYLENGYVSNSVHSLLHGAKRGLRHSPCVCLAEHLVA